MSILTIGEIRKGIEAFKNLNKKAKLVLWLEQEVPTWFEDRILVIDEDATEQRGYILAKCKSRVPTVDSLIAATALVHNLKIVTKNVKDFIMFPDLEIINPWN